MSDSNHYTIPSPKKMTIKCGPKPLTLSDGQAEGLSWYQIVHIYVFFVKPTIIFYRNQMFR